MESPLAYRVGDWELQPVACRLVRNGHEVKLSPRSTDVLIYLIERAGQVVTHEELLNRFWRGPVSSPNAVHKSIAELRHTFGNGNGRGTYIETVPKRGYRLMAPIQRLQTVGVAADLNGGSGHADGATPALPTAAGAGDAADTARPKDNPVVLGLSMGSAVVVSAFVMWVLWPQASIDARLIQVQNGSAVLVPTYLDQQPEDRELVATVIDRATARLGVAGRTMTRHLAHSGPSTDRTAAWGGADYRVDLEVRKSTEGLSASLAILPAAEGHLSHREHFAYPLTKRTAFVEEVANHLSEDLRILLDDQHTRRMREWGTMSVHAYRLARRADTFQAIHTVESQNQAADLFRQALSEDPGFPYAYGSLSAVYTTIAIIPTDTETREAARRNMQALLRDARVNLQDESMLAMLEQRYRLLSAGSLYDAETLMRETLLRSNEHLEALDRYSVLLMSAKLLAEAEAYRDRAVAIAKRRGDQDIDWLSMSYADLAIARSDYERAIRLTKWNVDKRPDFTISLYGLVKQLSKVGRSPEAEMYLARLKASDPAWAMAAEVQMKAIRGDLRAGSPELEQVFADPRVSNATRGDVCFILGDIVCGVHYWRNIEPGFLPLIRQFIASVETYFAPGVVMDAHYQALLQELGTGRQWREYMRSKAAEMTSVTGIAVTSPIPQEDLAAVALTRPGP